MNDLFNPAATLFESSRLTKPYDQEASDPTHIFSLGHGISQFAPPDHVAVWVEAAHRYSGAPRKHWKVRAILINSRIDLAHEMNFRIAL